MSNLTFRNNLVMAAVLRLMAPGMIAGPEVRSERKPRDEPGPLPVARKISTRKPHQGAKEMARRVKQMTK